jgi:hypothetical protein
LSGDSRVGDGFAAAGVVGAVNAARSPEALFWGSLGRATASWQRLDPKRAPRSGSLQHGQRAYAVTFCINSCPSVLA